MQDQGTERGYVRMYGPTPDVSFVSGIVGALLAGARAFLRSEGDLCGRRKQRPYVEQNRREPLRSKRYAQVG